MRAKTRICLSAPITVWSWTLLVLTAFLVAVPTNGQPQKPLPVEYQVKAAFLFNFTQFVEWPANAFPGAGSPLVIGILGKDPFGSFLDELVEGERVNGHPLAIRRYAGLDEISGCHILFINLPKSEFRNVLQNLRSESILTVSDVDGFLKSGGMVRLFTENNKIRIRVNLEPTKDAGLVISSKLLRLAQINTSKKN